MKSFFSVWLFIFLVLPAGIFSQPVQAAECSTIAGAGCVSGACPSDMDQVTATCSNNRTCCRPKSASTGGSQTGGENTTGGTSTTGSTSAVSINVSNPLKYSTVEGALTGIMNAIRNIVVTLAILMIVIGGIMYILSFGNADNMKKAKNVILAALVGLAIVLAAPAFLKEIYSVLGGGPEPAELSGALTLTQIARNILNFLLSIIGILALIMLIISGIMYLISAGNDTKMKTAKSIFVASLIGIAVAMGSLVLVSAVARFFT